MPRHAIPAAPSEAPAIADPALLKLARRLAQLRDEDLGSYAELADRLNETLSKAQRAFVAGYLAAPQ